MTIISIRGHEIKAIPIKDSFNRRALKFKNNIISNLRSIGVADDDVIIDLEPVAIKRLPAKAVWYIDEYHSHYSYKAGNKYVDNLYIISKLIELEVKAIKEGKKTVEEFINDFSENHEVEEERIAAREYLGLDENIIDLDVINKKYKLLAKDAHPDMPNGSTEKFKALNHAHKILKRELA